VKYVDCRSFSSFLQLDIAERCGVISAEENQQQGFVEGISSGLLVFQSVVPKI